MNRGPVAELQHVDLMWERAAANELVQAGAVEQVDAHLASPDRVPEGYSATAVAAIATESIKAVNKVDGAILAGFSLELGVSSARQDKFLAEDHNTFLAGMDKEFDKRPSAAELAERQQKVDAAEQAIQKAKANLAEAQPTLHRSEKIRATQQVLARGAMLLAVIPPAVVAGGVWGGFFWYVSHSGVQTTPIGGHEASADTPGAYPVFPEAPAGSNVTRNPDGTFTITTTITQDQQGERAINEFAPSCELTGTEAAADEAAAQKSLQLVKDASGAIKKIVITGYASDEARGVGTGLGQSNQTNECLSGKRLDKGVSVVQDKAQALGVQLPETIHKEAKEIILNEVQIAEIDALAEANGLSRASLINNYNGDRTKINSKAIIDLDKLLGNNRGITIELTVERQTETKAPQTEPKQQDDWIKTLEKYKVGGMGVEWLIGGTAAVFGGLMGVFGAGPIGSRLARYRARKIMRRAERAIASLAR